MNKPVVLSNVAAARHRGLLLRADLHSPLRRSCALELLFTKCPFAVVARRTLQLFLVLLGFSGIETARGASMQVVCTTSMVADLVREIGGRQVRVTALMGPGVDPHLYKASASDITKLQAADLVFFSGLMLEGKMQDLFARLAKAGRSVTAVTESIPRSRLLTPAGFDGHPDPHVWFDVKLWQLCAATVQAALTKADPSSANNFSDNHKRWTARMETLHSWVLGKVAELPVEKRILVTSHDAYNYFGRAYSFQVIGLQGISTVTEAGLADMTRLVDFILKHRIKAVFVESSVPRQTIDRISRDAGVKVGGEIFSDAMGTPGQMENGEDLGTYEGMIKHNVTTIVEALK